MWGKPIDPDFGEYTQIRIKQSVKAIIEETKIIPQEPLNDCLLRVFTYYRENHPDNKEEEKGVETK